MQQTKKRGLGRGLDALLGHLQVEPSVLASAADAPEKERIKQVPIHDLKPGVYQPRQVIDPAALHELTDSIKQHGLLQPILVRSLEKNKYEIIAGERRWRACQQAGLSTISAIIYDVSSKEAAAIALIENIQRENLNVMEEANALTRLVDEFHLTHQQAAEAVGKSRAAVTNLLRLTALHDEVQALLQRGDIEMGHGRALLSLAKPDQLLAARQVVARDLSVRETESLVRQWGKPKPMVNPPTEDPNIRSLESQLSERLGAPVKITHTPQGKGTIVIGYYSLEALEGILEKIQ